MPEADTTRAIAIVGGGPRGLFALDCLCGWAARYPHRRLAITLVDPAARPGAGPVYDPNQPDYLLMNFAAGLIDAWDRAFASNAQRPALVDWLARTNSASADPGAYVPRATVGRYLMACYEILARGLPANVHLVHRQAFVDEVSRCGARWQIVGAGHTDQADEVLITTGHQAWQSKPGARPVSVFPAARLAEHDDTPGAALRCKGFGLTFIDAALALTVGRGGRFETRGSGQLRYRASGHEPACIRPVSRTGRPMLAKPDPGVIQATPARDDIVAELSRWLAERPRPIQDFVSDIWPAFLTAADAYIQAAPGTTRAWFTAWCDSHQSAEEARATLRQSWAMASGRCPPGPGVALALVWRGAYPALVRIVSHDGLAPAAWGGFRAVATEMERIAFGPAASNIARLLALIDAGQVDLSALGAPSDAACDIDATIAPPYRLDPAGPLPGLVARERLARTAYDTLAVNAHGRPIHAPSGQPVAGLAVIGRVTELSVLGNDTLSRRLHDTMRDWAATVFDGRAHTDRLT